VVSEISRHVDYGARRLRRNCFSIFHRFGVLLNKLKYSASPSARINIIAAAKMAIALKLSNANQKKELCLK
jgi:hypothetical protein